MDGETITLGMPVSVNGAPAVVVANDDVVLNNNTILSTTGTTQTVQINADTTGAAVNNTAGNVIEGASRAVNIDGDNATITNNGIIRGTGNQRNGTIYANASAQGFAIENSATGTIDAGMGNDGAGVALEIGNMGNPVDGSITNAGLIQGRGQASAMGGTAGDGIRLFGPGVLPAYVFNGDITNSGTIASESTIGTVAGVRFANRIGFQGTLENTSTGVISGAQNGLYFGDADHTGSEVINDGIISSDSRALNIDGEGLEILNRGQIIGTGNQRNGTVYADSTAQNFVLNNEGTIDAGMGNEGAAFSVELDAAGNEFTLNNTSSGVIQGRGQASAGAATAGDGIRFERTRVAGALDGSTTGLFTGDINNAGLISSESAQGTAAGIRFVNGTSFTGTLTNSATGVISGTQNGLYFGNATPAGGGDFTGAVVNNAGTISSDSRALNIDGLGLTVNNSGSILGTGAQRNGTVYADGTGTDFTVNNSGTIDAVVSGSGFAAEIQTAGNTFAIDNSGTIAGRGQGSAATGAAGDGIRIGNVGNVGLATIAIDNSGTISSDSAVGTTAGLRIVNGISAAGTIDNSGTISGVQNGLYLGNDTPAGPADFSDLVVTNTATGVISSDSRAVNIDGTGVTLNNAGEILGTGAQRNGTVYSDGTAQDFTVNNSGTIDAGEGLNGSGFAAEIGPDGNAFVFDNSGTIQGRGQGVFSDGFRIGNGGNVGIATVAITNSGVINSESTGSGAVSGLRFVNGISFAGTIDNSGTISGAQNGVYFGNPAAGQGGDHSNGVFNNLAGGVISSDSRAFNIDGIGLTVNNSGSILGTGNQRNGTIYADSTAQDFTLNNTSTGVIDAGEGNEGAGFSVELSSAGNNFDINNDGTIQGRGQASAGAAGAGDGLRFERTRNAGALDGSTTGLFTGNIVNTGTIDSESAQGTAAGIRFVNGTSFNGTIDNSGTISGVQNGLYFGNATPAGGGDFTGAIVNNSGTISSDSRALNIDGLGLTVNNSGSILGTGTQRNGTVYSDATADQYTLNNTSTGVIDAGIGNSGSGVSLQSGNVDGETVSFTLNNAGVIQGRGTQQVPAGLRIFAGAANVSVDGDVTNSGTIASETGAAILIQDVDFTGTITNSGTLSGSSVLDASTALGGVTFNQIGGAFDADFIGSDFDDALTISGPTFGLNADVIGGVETTVNAASTTVSGVRSIEGNLTSNGNLTLDLGNDSLAVDGNTTFGSDSTVTVTTNTDVNDLVLNSPITVISETGTFTNNGLSVNVIDDDFLVDYSVTLDTVTVTATAADLSGTSNDSNVSAVASAISAAFAAGQLSDSTANFFNAATSEAGFEGIVVSALPTLNEGVSRETWETHSRTASYVADRLVKGAPGGAWVQGSTRSADLDAESLSVEGYGADTTAVTFGYDREVSDVLRLGASFTFANSDIDEDVNAGETNELDTNQIAVYGGYDAGDILVSGQVGYIFGDGESSRVSDLGVVTGEYDVTGFTAQAIASYDLGALKPEAGLRYGSISQDDFTETGGLNLDVDVDSVNYLEAVIGASISPELESAGNWIVKPTLRANYLYDVIGDARNVNVTLAGAPSQALTSGDASGSRFEIGAGVDLVNTSGLSIGVAYEGDFASGYSSNTGLVRARIGF